MGIRNASRYLTRCFGLVLTVALPSNASTATQSRCDELFIASPAPPDFGVIGIAPLPTLKRLQLVANRAHGMTWESANRDWPDHPSYSTSKSLLQSVNSPLLNFTAHTSDVGFFPAEFSVMRASYSSRRLDDGFGVPASAFTFNMNLAASEIQKSFAGKIPNFAFPHVQDSFGYVRFYVKGDDIIVTEIQSEMYRHLRNRGLNPAYAKWSRQLLLAFEEYVQATFFSRREAGRILIAGPEYQQRRWRFANSGEGLAPDLARMLYRDLPKRMGYAPAKTKGAFEWAQAPREGEKRTLEVVDDAYAISKHDLEERNRTSARGKISVVDIGGATRKIRTTLAEIEAATHRADVIAPVQIGSQLASHVAYTVLPDSLLYSDMPELKKVHAWLMGEVPTWVQAFSKMTLVSRGTVGATEIAQEFIDIGGKRYRYEQWVGADRHPTLKLLGEHGAFSMKGAGRRSLELNDDLSPSIFAVQKSETASHRVWGGLLEKSGRYEFLNHLWLWDLGQRAGLNPSIAIPIDVGWMEQAPIRPQGEKANRTELTSMKEIVNGDLAKAPDRIVQFRTFSKSPYRVLALQQVIHDSHAFTELAKPLLEALYAAYDEKLKWIGDPPLTNDYAARYRFLHAVYLANKPAADRIANEFDRRTLETIGFLHGLGGHFGGISTQVFESPNGEIFTIERPIGAPSGGSTQLRNVSLAGELRDLDENVFIPGLKKSEWSQYADILENSLREFQRQDLKQWQETHAQFKGFLFGKTGVPRGTEFPVYTFGDPKFGSGIILRPFGHSELERARSAYLDEDLRQSTSINVGVDNPNELFISSRHRELYLNGFQAAQDLQ